MLVKAQPGDLILFFSTCPQINIKSESYIPAVSQGPARRSNSLLFKAKVIFKVLVEAQPGDLILWDSRLIHGGRTGLGPMEESA